MSITDRPWKTWIGHALQGFLLGLVFIWISKDSGAILAALALGYHFGIREYAGIRSTFGTRNRPLLWDGILDFVTPFVGLIVAGWVLLI